MISIKGKKRLSLCLATLVLGVNLMCFSTVVFATPDSLNEIGGSQQTVEAPATSSNSNQTSTTTENNTTSSTSRTQTQTTQSAQSSNVSESNKSSAAAVGEIFKQGGLTQESVEKSKKWVEPVAKVINLVMAVVLGIFSALLVLVSVLDMVYIGLPFTRPYLCPNAQQPQQTGMGMGASPMMGGYGRGGMMNGMGGMTGGMQQQQSSGLAATIGQWISDDALNAVREAQATQQGGASPMMSGFGMQAQAQQSQSKGKSLIMGYLKKRSFTLIMLGVCLVLFTCTVFTDLGTMIGMKLLSLLSGISM